VIGAEAVFEGSSKILLVAAPVSQFGGDIIPSAIFVVRVSFSLVAEKVLENGGNPKTDEAEDVAVATVKIQEEISEIWW
jgi:hypothetical protein